MAAGRNPPVAQGLWYTGSMGPTIPDQCRFAPLTADPAAQEQYRLTCKGCGYGTINPTTRGGLLPCARGHNTTDPDTCAGMICRRNEGITFRSVTDGLSNTILAAETLPGHWIWNCVYCDNFPVSSTHIPLNTMESRTDATDHWLIAGFKSQHPGGANCVLADGSVRFLNETIDYVTYNVLGSRASGQVVESSY